MRRRARISWEPLRCRVARGSRRCRRAAGGDPRRRAERAERGARSRSSPATQQLWRQALPRRRPRRRTVVRGRLHKAARQARALEARLRGGLQRGQRRPVATGSTSAELSSRPWLVDDRRLAVGAARDPRLLRRQPRRQRALPDPRPRAPERRGRPSRRAVHAGQRSTSPAAGWTPATCSTSPRRPPSPRRCSRRRRGSTPPTPRALERRGGRRRPLAASRRIPAPGLFIAQVGDERDHELGFRDPADDDASRAARDRPAVRLPGDRRRPRRQGGGGARAGGRPRAPATAAAAHPRRATGTRRAAAGRRRPLKRAGYPRYAGDFYIGSHWKDSMAAGRRRALPRDLRPRALAPTRYRTTSASSLRPAVRRRAAIGAVDDFALVRRGRRLRRLRRRRPVAGAAARDFGCELLAETADDRRPRSARATPSACPATFTWGTTAQNGAAARSPRSRGAPAGSRTAAPSPPVPATTCSAATRSGAASSPASARRAARSPTTGRSVFGTALPERRRRRRPGAASAMRRARASAVKRPARQSLRRLRGPAARTTSPPSPRSTTRRPRSSCSPRSTLAAEGFPLAPGGHIAARRSERRNDWNARSETGAGAPSPTSRPARSTSGTCPSATTSPPTSATSTRATKPAMVWERFDGDQREVDWGELQDLANQAANVLAAHGVERGRPRRRRASRRRRRPRRSSSAPGSSARSCSRCRSSTATTASATGSRTPSRRCSSPTPPTPTRFDASLVDEMIVLDADDCSPAQPTDSTSARTPRPTTRPSSTTRRAPPGMAKGIVHAHRYILAHEEFIYCHDVQRRRALPRHGRVGLGRGHLAAARPVAPRRDPVRLPARGRLRPAQAARLPLPPRGHERLHDADRDAGDDGDRGRRRALPAEVPRSSARPASRSTRRRSAGSASSTGVTVLDYYGLTESYPLVRELPVHGGARGLDGQADARLGRADPRRGREPGRRRASAARSACAPAPTRTTRSATGEPARGHARRPSAASGSTPRTPPTQDEDGYFWYAGRADDVIIAAGYRIGPFEVESACIEHPAVARGGRRRLARRGQGQRRQGVHRPRRGPRALRRARRRDQGLRPRAALAPTPTRARSSSSTSCRRR